MRPHVSTVLPACLPAGSGTQGQLGDGTSTDSSVPMLVSGGRLYKYLSVGYKHTCAVNTTGYAFCWGESKDRRRCLPSEHACGSERGVTLRNRKFVQVMTPTVTSGMEDLQPACPRPYWISPPARYCQITHRYRLDPQQHAEFWLMERACAGVSDNRRPLACHIGSSTACAHPSRSVL